ncbi:MAG: TraX family protein [Lachnospiraceae bacterium]
MNKEQQISGGISSFTLHILAMALMLCDHLWATLFPAQEWLTCIGRIAFPIFAFMIAEGYFHTSNVKKYITRLLIFAIVSEVPFDLLYGSTVIYPFHQNVLWTFLIALLAIVLIEKTKAKKKLWLTVFVSVVTVFAALLLGTITMVDYFGAGVVTVLVFYFFHGRKWWCLAGQLVCLYILNINILGGYYYSVSIGGYELELVQQGFALLALIPIWLYHGRLGYHSKGFQYFCYAFYPVHLLLLYIIWRCVA